jgi:hypothetical protein
VNYLGKMAVVSSLCLTFAACGGDDDGGSNCPPCNASATSNSIAGLRIHSGIGDGKAREILSECSGWNVHQGHNGGMGDTLEISACPYLDDEGGKRVGIVLVWAYGEFRKFLISAPGFKGTFNGESFTGWKLVGR